MPDDSPTRVAVTLEQCWHRVPGGTASSILELVRGLADRDDLDLRGVAAWHRRPPEPPYRPSIAVSALPLPGRNLLYESWHRARRPPVQWATGPVDVIHATAVAIPPKTAPLVVTVHDLAFLADASQATDHGNRFFRRGTELAMADADTVICPSLATSAECASAGFDPARLRVVPWGVRQVSVAEGAVGQVLRRHGINGRYVLFVGTLEPRKNLAGLIDAFGRVATECPDVTLVLVGPAGWNEDLGTRIAAAGLADRARPLGFLPEDEKLALLAGAAAFCYPSLREGFGLPVLEAMAQGAPVVTSAGTATEEVAGDAGVLVDPRDPATIADALLGILEEPDRAAELSRRGRARARHFTWQRTVELTAEAYRAVAS